MKLANVLELKKHFHEDANKCNVPTTTRGQILFSLSRFSYIGYRKILEKPYAFNFNFAKFQDPNTQRLACSTKPPQLIPERNGTPPSSAGPRYRLHPGLFPWFWTLADATAVLAIQTTLCAHTKL